VKRITTIPTYNEEAHIAAAFEEITRSISGALSVERKMAMNRMAVDDSINNKHARRDTCVA